MRVDEAVAALPLRVRAEVEKKIDALLVQIAQDRVKSQVVCPYEVERMSGKPIPFQVHYHK
ncbi:hypothetical protein NUACC21_78010 [Scytonema sp. NUACC21]